jgi:hypothetical protein
MRRNEENIEKWESSNVHDPSVIIGEYYRV